ncbi:MAG: rpfC 2 [Chthoniobacteraceae bacterium]|nr:rpfC 2 [Chthoniobacteraceae bacterium]
MKTDKIRSIRTKRPISNRVRFRAAKERAMLQDDTKSRETNSPVIPLRILIAEDDTLVNKVLFLILTQYGYSVRSAANGRDAVKLLEADMNAFDLVITDHEMPKLNGLGLVRHLRAVNYPGRIIVFASPPNPEDQHAYSALSIDRLLFKPMQNKLLIQAIQEVALKR